MSSGCTKLSISRSIFERLLNRCYGSFNHCCLLRRKHVKISSAKAYSSLYNNGLEFLSITVILLLRGDGTEQSTMVHFAWTFHQMLSEFEAEMASFYNGLSVEWDCCKGPMPVKLTSRHPGLPDWAQRHSLLFLLYLPLWYDPHRYSTHSRSNGMRSGETSAKAAAVHIVCTSEVITFTHDTISITIPQLQPWELWAPSIDQTGPMMNDRNPKTASIDSQADIFADDNLPEVSVCIFVKRYCFISELSESMITQR